MRITSSIRTAFAALTALAFTQAANAQTARVQIVHNCPDPAAAVVDVWVNNQLTLDNFAFRTATPFLTLPSGTDLTIRIKPSNSQDTTNPLFRQTLNLPNNATLIVAAQGQVTATNTNPDNLNTAFRLSVAGGRESFTGGQVGVSVFHGAPDAPTVDVQALGVGTLVNNIAFGQSTDGAYLGVPNAAYTLAVATADGATRVANFSADLSGFADSALVVFASGYLTPTVGQPAFQLMAVTRSGRTLLIPASTSAPRIQVVHNSPDPAAASVAVWVNNTRVLNGVAFRTASGYVNAPEGPFDVTITAADARDTINEVYRQRFTLENGRSYQVFASGYVSLNTANPDGINNRFSLVPVVNTNESWAGSATANETQFRVIHDSPNAPTVDVRVRGLGTIVDNAPYRAITNYFTVPASDVIVDVLDRNSSTVVASYTAPLSTLPRNSFTVAASGILGGSGSTAFGLVAILPNGDVVALPTTDAPAPARVQVIHNSADALADSVDIYLNGSILLNNFPYRGATPFINFPSTVNASVAIAPKNSTSAADALLTQVFNLNPGQRAVVIANGLLAPATYRANPNGRSTAFRLTVISPAIETTPGDSVQLAVAHGVTDAPQVGLNLSPSGTAVLPDTIGFGSTTPYLRLQAAPISFYLEPVRNLVFTAPLNALRGAGIVVVASGFFNAEGNQANKPFTLLAVANNGDVTPLPVVNSIAPALATNGKVSLFPNPVNGNNLSIGLELVADANLTATIIDATGKVVSNNVLGSLSGAQVINLPVANLSSGLYTIKLADSEGKSSTLRFIKK
jgi:hypothetical protein